MEINKPINLDKSLEFYKKLSLSYAKKRIVIKDKSYHILAFVSGKSFRNLKIEDKYEIKKRLISAIDQQVDKKNIQEIFNERLAVRLELFLNESYMNKVDIDNVTKTVFDCLNKVLWKDDKQIKAMDVIKVKAPKKGAIGLTVGRFLSTRVVNS